MKQNKEITFSKQDILDNDNFKLIDDETFVQVHYKNRYIGIIDKTNEPDMVHCYIYEGAEEMNRIMRAMRAMSDNNISFEIKNVRDHTQEQTYTVNL